MITRTTTDNERGKFVEQPNGISSLRTIESSMSKRFEYDINNNLIYVGNSYGGANESDAVWLVKQFVYDISNNLLSIKVANGTESFTADWINRATHTYI